MDKYEYKVRADEIKELISRCEYAQAAEIADTIDWRRVKSVMMLCTISDLYKINRRYEDARDMLLLAYERRPGGRTICYSLCELSIKTEEYVAAVEYYKEFVQAAPKDPGRFILQYKLYEAQDVSLEERVAVLEELKKRDYREKWAYELAYLYHRIGLAARCVEECDELILWFGDGKYVIKAMELKMLHQPLSPSQQEKYDHRFEAQMGYQQVQAAESYATDGGAENIAGGIENSGGTDAVDMENNMVAQGNGEWGRTIVEEQAYQAGEVSGAEEYTVAENAEMDNAVTQEYTIAESAEQAASESEEELDIHVKTMDMGQYNTINLQAELAEGLREVLAEEHVKNSIQDPITRAIVAPMLEMDTETLDYPEIDEVSEDDLEPVAEEIEATEVFFGETGEIGDVPPVPKTVPDITAEIVMEQLRQENVVAETVQQPVEVVEEREPEAEVESAGIVAQEAVTAYAAIEAQPLENATKMMHAEPPRELAHVLSQESDGQLSLVMPESEQIEKQITGQMNIEDILAEWERIKKENQEKRQEEVRRHVLQQTGNMFTEFEAAVRDGLLEQLEREKDAKAAGVNNMPVGTGVLSEETVEAEEFKGEMPREELPEEVFFEEAVPEQDGELGEVEELEEIIEEVEQLLDDESSEAEPADEHAEAYEAEFMDDGTGLEEAESVVEEEIFEETESVAEGTVLEETDAVIEEESFEGAETVTEEGSFEGAGTVAEEENLEGAETVVREEIFEETESIEQSAEAYEAEVTDVEEAIEQPGHKDEAAMVEELQAMVEQLPITEVQQKRLIDPEYEETMEELRAAASGFEEAMVKLQAPMEQERQQEEQQLVKAAVQQEAQPISSETEKQENSSISSTAVAQENEQTTQAAVVREEPKQAPRMEREKAKVRALTREEKELYAPFIQSRAAREQLVRAIDNITLAAYTGNVIITGEEGMDILTLAKNMIRELQATDSNFSGKVAKISGHALNEKDVAATIGQLKNGALIISKVSELNENTVGAMYKALQQEHQGIVVVLLDARKPMDKFLAKYEQLKDLFTARMDVEALSNDTLVAFGRRYARELEYSIDELGMLALHTRIAERQTIDHVVTVIEVKEIVDKAIRRANKKTLGHFFDILLAKRYDDEDMIVLSERDFA